MDLSVIDQGTLNITDTTFDEVEWYLDEIKEFAYLSACASDSTYTETCIGPILNDNEKIESNNTIWSVINEFSSSRALV